jgi:beta-lactam-binding protein with PASTA domain
MTGEEQFIGTATGGKVAAPIWRQFMEYATDGMPVLEFPPDPPGTDIYRQTPFTVVPLPGQSTKTTIDDIYAVGLRTEIVEIPSTLPQGSFIDTAPLAGTRLRQGSTVFVQVSSGVPPEVALVDLRGLKPAQIPAAIAAFRELTGISVTWGLVDVTTANPALHGIVVSTNPIAGSPVNQGHFIEVRVGRAP